MDPKDMSLAEASRIAGITEDELRCAIKDGILQGNLNRKTGEWTIDGPDLQAYLVRTQRILDKDGPRKHRVLIIDDEINFANLMKLELERDRRIEAKFATWGKDGIKLAKSFEPDLCLIDFMLPDTTGDEVLAALRKQPGGQKRRMIVYSAHTRDAIQANPDLEARLQGLGADEFMSKSGGLRPLTIRVLELLGLESRTKRLKRFKA